MSETQEPASYGSALIVGYGYLGKPLAERLRQAGMRVWATTRRTERFGEIRSAGLEPVLWDVLEPPEQDLPATDLVVYCVGYDRSIGSSMREIYVEGLGRTLERLPVPRRLAYVSSTGVYGATDGAWMDEETTPAPADPSGEVVLEAETRLREIADRSGIPWMILRFAGLYGPGRIIGSQGLRERKPIPADPEAFVNLVHVRDGARAVLAAAEQGRPGTIYLVADGRPVPRREFYGHLAELLETPEPVFAPDQARRVRGNRRICSRRLTEDLGFRFDFPDYRSGLADCVASA